MTRRTILGLGPAALLTLAAVLTVASFLMSAAPAGASENATSVDRGFTHTEFFADDICGARASTVTFTETMAQSQLIYRADGTFAYRDVAVVTYVVDFVDPALPDDSSRLTEVNHFILTPGENTFVVSNTFHAKEGDLKIWERRNLKIVGDEVLVDTFVLEATGCP